MCVLKSHIDSLYLFDKHTGFCQMRVVSGLCCCSHYLSLMLQVKPIKAWLHVTKPVRGILYGAAKNNDWEKYLTRHSRVQKTSINDLIVTNRISIKATPGPATINRLYIWYTDTPDLSFTFCYCDFASIACPQNHRSSRFIMDAWRLHGPGITDTHQLPSRIRQSTARMSRRCHSVVLVSSENQTKLHRILILNHGFHQCVSAAST